MSTIGIRLASDSDWETWDALVKEFPGVPPYQVYAWKDILESIYSAPCYFSLAENNDQNLSQPKFPNPRLGTVFRGR